MDHSTAAGDDFYRFVNGAWLERTQLPADRPVLSAFADARFDANARVRSLLEDASHTARIGSSAWKAVQLYRAFLDDKTVEQLGGTPLEAKLNGIAGMRSRGELASAMGSSFLGFGASLFQIDLAYDRKDPKHYAAYLGQAGLGLPDRDYYLENSFAGSRSEYEDYIAGLLRLCGWADAHGRAADVLALETKIAKASWTHAEERDPVQSYAPTSQAQLLRDAPGFTWPAFFRGAGLAGQRRVVVTTKTSISRLTAIFSSTPLPVWRAWLAFHVADSAAPFLSDAFAELSFNFHARAMAGQSASTPRWVGAVDLANNAMGSEVGELYTAQYLSERSRAQVEDLVADLQAALKERLGKLDWMSDTTRNEALRKLANLNIQVGYPQHWINYGSLRVSRSDLFGDVQRTRAFDWNRRIAQLDGPWNTSDWRFWPQYPTAYTENNNLIFTASLLQAPFFDPGADAAVNYGAIGSVIGHELTHSFDDQGRHEDAESRLRDWWTAADAANFESRADRLRIQYSAIEPLAGLHIRGDVTLGENIADLGGVAIALEAYELRHGDDSDLLLDGFNGRQRFFLSWAQIWREKRRDDDLRRLVTTDVHSPGSARVNGVVKNLDDWYTSFDVLRKDKLFLPTEQRTRIW